MPIGVVAEEPIRMGDKGRAVWIFKEGTPLVFLTSTSNGLEGNAEYHEAQGSFQPCPLQRSLVAGQSPGSGLMGWDNLPFLIWLHLWQLGDVGGDQSPTVLYSWPYTHTAGGPAEDESLR